MIVPIISNGIQQDAASKTTIGIKHIRHEVRPNIAQNMGGP
jgi:hypothetical protein